MSLQQLSAVRRWHALHRRLHSVEQHMWDFVLTCWVLGWVGVPPAVVLAPWLGLAGCAVLACAPELYLVLRTWLHRNQVLRCDWLASAAPPR